MFGTSKLGYHLLINHGMCTYSVQFHFTITTFWDTAKLLLVQIYKFATCKTVKIYQYMMDISKSIISYCAIFSTIFEHFFKIILNKRPENYPENHTEKFNILELEQSNLLQYCCIFLQNFSHVNEY